MLIALEGLDKTGKSTLARKLSAELKIPIIKFSKPKGDPYTEYMQFLLKHKGDAILDRFYLGELAYGPVYRRKAGLTKQQVINIERLFRARNGVHIYCSDETNNIAKRFEEDGEDFARVEDIDRLKTLFTIALEESTVYYLRHVMKSSLDLTKPKEFKRVTKFLRHLKTLENKYIPGFTGNLFQPKIVLIGNTHNDNYKKYLKVKVPFDFGFSSLWLNQEIKDSGVYDPEITFSNSDTLNKKNWHDLLNLEPDVIFVLGEPAKKRIKRLNIGDDFHNNVKYLGHPAYEGRFKRSQHNIKKQLAKHKVIW